MKKACDGCKIRKVRCGGGHPCRPCVNARVQCSYNRVQQARGPQKLRATTRYLIEQNQRNDPAPPGPSQRDEIPPARLPTNVIASLLYIYHLRMYAVWPVLYVDSLIATLQLDREGKDHETRALATAVAAATMAQLRLGNDSVEDRFITADILVAECLEARKSFDYRSRVNLNGVRTAFFLHVFYENQQPGGSESLLYLREAITLAQMMYLHREASYAGLTSHEQQLRRRVLWLLFVTERGVCILHKLPVVLKTDTAMPGIDTDDEPQVLPAFVKLLALFKLFEQSRMFDIVEDYHLGLKPPLGSASTTDTTIYDILQDRFRDGPGALDQVSDVQRADICVTRHWMRILTWKALSGHTMRSPQTAAWPLSPIFPLLVARDLVNVVCRLPRTALQAHGLGMQLKLHEVADSLADSVTNIVMLKEVPTWDQDSRPSSILARLHSILLAFKDGGNNALVEILYQKMAYAQFLSSPSLMSPLSGPHSKGQPDRGMQSTNSALGNEAETFEGGFPQYDSGRTGVEANRHGNGFMDGDSANGNTDANQEILSISGPSSLSNLSDQILGNSWSYVQSTHDPLASTAFQQFDASTGLVTVPAMFAPLETNSLDTVLNHVIFDSPLDGLSLDTYLSLTTPSRDTQCTTANIPI
ncbi:hypothetical protein BDW59DRAFT_165165 [Aspergillus cavernicola]|uniref:Zn(2)-C6 fungal-type domain-containing protein n=1 Tax=Aspergillus cavernicola TaxID=176166 RepID=A0ABR4HUZ3_9EURO